MTETLKNHRMQDILLYEQNLLEDDERRELEEHLRTCAECQATVVTVKKYLPLLHEALKPNELPAEELLARVKAQMRAKKEKPAPLFTRLRVAVVGFALAAATAIAVAVQALLQPFEPALVGKAGADAGAQTLAAPRPPPRTRPDAGVDGGIGDAGAVPNERPVAPASNDRPVAPASSPESDRKGGEER